jgi:hypothetical protein
MYSCNSAAAYETVDQIVHKIVCIIHDHADNVYIYFDNLVLLFRLRVPNLGGLKAKVVVIN